MDFKLIAGASTNSVGSADSFPFTNAWRNAPAGRYTVVAEATDTAGNTVVSRLHDIRIDPPNSAPIVDAGPDQPTNLPHPVQLAGSANDDGLRPASEFITTD